MPTVLLRRPEVCRRVGLKSTQLYELVSRGLFPRQVKLSDRASAWVESEIEDWINSRITASRGSERAA